VLNVDPDTALVMAALAAGVSAGVSKTVSNSITDSYALLKARLQKNFKDNPKAEQTWADYEADPETYRKPLSKQVEATGANKDEEILQAAQELVSKARSAGDHYNVNVSGGIVGIIGPNGSFDGLPPRS
jgi:hypothetical protein